jgi:hypothetical protein
LQYYPFLKLFSQNKVKIRLNCLYHKGNSTEAYGLTWQWVSQYLRDGLLYGEVRGRRKTKLIECNAKCRHL